METRDLAYMAGLVDMRCRVSLAAGRNMQKLCIRATVTRTPTVAEFLQRVVGGGVISTSERKDSHRRPCSAHCKHAHQSIAGSTSMSFALYGTRAAIVLDNCEPFLLRWSEYEEPFMYFRTHVPEMDKIKLDKTVADMLALGWEIPEWLGQF
jgi:hypothetical protein